MNKIKALMGQTDVLFSMSCYDALSARIAQQAGFPLCSISGLASEAAERCAPDLGMGSVTEFARRAANVVNAIDIPLICDVDTGFGGPLNVVRTTRLMEDAGAAAIHIEDQTFPKRCGVLAGKSVVDIDSASRRVRAAADARRGQEMLIVARTDSKSLGLDEVIRRLNAFAENGADIGMVGDYFTKDEYTRIAKETALPLLTCAVEASNANKQPYLTADEWRETGVRIVMYWHVALFAAIRAVSDIAAQLYRETTNAQVESKIATYGEYAGIVGLKDWMDMGDRYGGEETRLSVPGGSEYKS